MNLTTLWPGPTSTGQGFQFVNTIINMPINFGDISKNFTSDLFNGATINVNLNLNLTNKNQNAMMNFNKRF